MIAAAHAAQRFPFVNCIVCLPAISADVRLVLPIPAVADLSDYREFPEEATTCSSCCPDRRREFRRVAGYDAAYSITSNRNNDDERRIEASIWFGRPATAR